MNKKKVSYLTNILMIPICIFFIIVLINSYHEIKSAENDFSKTNAMIIDTFRFRVRGHFNTGYNLRYIDINHVTKFGEITPAKTEKYQIGSRSIIYYNRKTNDIYTEKEFLGNTTW